ncbi:MAG TPA: hypothetical protein PLM93_11465 [Sulfuricurvum sp.]|nr:MAG: hypothetical protein B7Y30_06760 [Campylobacterales bacterium 16-40-21]OZA02201.1 MAG: hypothetical protein B7X89_10225 [Sulfuricurvum sp. 17-40-25]HQS67792.1 hypothetical protein [Sulfuricurvum sp.]HQT36311.1 hypothetical protein [Sulfuricurvum sp.]
MSKILIFLTLWSSISTHLLGACTTEQGAYSGGYQAGIEQKSSSDGNKNFDYSILQNGNCHGVIQAYSGAKMIAPKQFKTSTDTVYALCVQGARDGYDGKKTGKFYKIECIDYPIAKVK